MNIHTAHKSMTPRYFFLSLGMFIALATVSIAFINLVFGTLDQAFPDALNASYQYGYNTGMYDSIRTTLATVIIFFPVYIALAYFWAKFSRVQLSQYNTVLRKWVLYCILFLVVLVVAIDLVTLVRYFISGEMTTRFILKVMSIIVIATTVFWYYFRELRADLDKKFKTNFIFLGIASVFVIVGIVYSFSVIGTPATQRALRFDQKRIEDLQNIQSQVITYWQQKEKLPAKLEDMIDPLNNWQVLPKDPEFQKGINYEYSATGVMEFKLCATFAQPIPQGWQQIGAAYPMPMYDKAVSSGIAPSGTSGYAGAQNENWGHQAGRTCFARKIDPQIYPPNKNNEIKAL